MSSRRLLLIVLAIVLAVVAAGGFFVVLSNAKDKADKVGNTVHVLVAERAIPRTTSGDDAVSQGLLVERLIPDSAKPPLALLPSQKDSVKGELLSTDLGEGQIVLSDSFKKPGSAGTGALQIADGEQAMTISIDSVHGVGGAIEAGDHVNVLVLDDAAQVIQKAPGPVEATKAATFVLQNIKVLNVGQNIAPSQSSATTTTVAGSSSASNILTVEVDPGEAARLALATTKTMYLTLVPSSFTPLTNPPTAYDVYDAKTQLLANNNY